MMRRVLLLALLAAGCRTSIVHDCPASAGDSATCEEACANLEHLDCLPGGTEEECVTGCQAQSGALAEDVRGRVLSCYATVDSCRAVDGCSRSCGDDDGPVHWDLDAGTPTPDAGADAGLDAGPGDAGLDAGPDAG